MDSTTVSVSFRRRSGEAIEDREWATVAAGLFESGAPWRTFRWYKGQKHYSGTYWSATTSGHVVYESLLELTQLLFADFDPLIKNIKAQPFLLKSLVDGKVRKHIPDYLLITNHGPVVVDVKPRRRLSHSDVAFTIEWTRQAVESRGWRYEVWSEPPEEELENVRFLAGYRRKWLFSPELLDELRGSDLDGVALGEAVHLLPDWPVPHVRAALHHLLWTGDLVTDLSQPLSSHLLLSKAP